MECEEGEGEERGAPIFLFLSPPSPIPSFFLSTFLRFWQRRRRRWRRGPPVVLERWKGAD